MRNLCVVCAVLVVWGTVPAAGQTGGPRVLVSVNAAVQPAPQRVSDPFTFEAELETATVDVGYDFVQGTIVDGGVAVRLWKRMGAGVAVSRYSRDASATVTAAIPHPFFFEQPRDIAGEATGLARSETAVHLQIVYILPTTGRLRVLLTGGPSRIEVEQEIVTAVQYDEAFPFDTATFRSATSRGFKDAAVGFNAGADVSFMFTRMFGVGGLVRFSRASVDLGPDDRRISFDAGGVQAGGGLRVVF